MSSLKLSGTDAAIAQQHLAFALGLADTVTMIVMGPDQQKVFERAEKSADKNPSTWWVVWVQDLDLLTPAQRSSYTGDDPNNVVCVLAKSDKRPVVHLPAVSTRQRVLNGAFLSALRK